MHIIVALDCSGTNAGSNICCAATRRCFPPQILSLQWLEVGGRDPSKCGLLSPFQSTATLVLPVDSFALPKFFSSSANLRIECAGLGSGAAAAAAFGGAGRFTCLKSGMTSQRIKSSCVVLCRVYALEICDRLSTAFVVVCVCAGVSSSGSSAEPLSGECMISLHSLHFTCF